MTGEPLEVVGYDPAWPERFEVVAARLRQVLGGLEVSVEHVGSTSVPGLAWDGNRHAFLLDVAVTPGRRGQGVGRRVVERAVLETRRSGCEWLHVDHTKDLARFFETCGFTTAPAGSAA